MYVLSYRGTLPTVPMSGDPETGIAGMKVLRIRGQTAHDWFGFAIARAGDVVGDTTYGTETLADGVADLLIGAPGGPLPFPPGAAPTTSGRAYVVSGADMASALNSSSLPIGAAADFVIVPGVNCARLKGNDGTPEGDLGARFGTSVCALGDLDVDGRNEFAIGAIESWFDCTLNEGNGGLVFLGAPRGNGRVRVYTAGAALAVAQVDELEGVGRGDWFGYSIASGVEAPIGTVPGDANGDSLPDMLVGAPLSNGDPLSSFDDAGTAYLYSGADLFDGGTELPLASIHGDQQNEHAGHAIALGGKLDHEGQAEFAVGSRDFSVSSPPDDVCLTAVGASGLFDRVGQVGRARVFCGAHPTYTQLIEIHGIQARSHLGWAVVWLPPSEPYAYDFTELLMTMPGFAACVGVSGPNGCADPSLPDGRREIGRAHIRLFHPTP